MSKKHEVRNFVFDNFETRATEDGKNILSGYASVFNNPTEIFPQFMEQVAPTAFTKTLKENKAIKGLVNHNTDLVLGSTKSKTLSLSTDERGLKFELELGNQNYAIDLLESVKRGDIDGCSFGFQTTKENFEQKADGSILRTIQEVKLYEISIVAFPAYADTSVNLRDLFDTEEEYSKLFADKITEERTNEAESKETTSETTVEERAQTEQPEQKPNQEGKLLFVRSL